MPFILVSGTLGEEQAVEALKSGATGAGGTSRHGPALREMAATFLGRLGYNMLMAASGQKAIDFAPLPEPRQVDLLLTDLTMPHMTGPELARSIRVRQPRIKVLYTSGYAENSPAESGAAPEGVELLQKPFPPTLLARRVREVLDQK